MSSWSVCLEPLYIFWLGCLAFCCWVVWVLDVFWILMPCHIWFPSILWIVFTVVQTLFSFILFYWIYFKINKRTRLDLVNLVHIRMRTFGIHLVYYRKVATHNLFMREYIIPTINTYYHISVHTQSNHDSVSNQARPSIHLLVSEVILACRNFLMACFTSCRRFLVCGSSICFIFVALAFGILSTRLSQRLIS